MKTLTNCQRGELPAMFVSWLLTY